MDRRRFLLTSLASVLGPPQGGELQQPGELDRAAPTPSRSRVRPGDARWPSDAQWELTARGRRSPGLLLRGCASGPSCGVGGHRFTTTGVLLQFHYSWISGAASWVSWRTRASVSPLQPPSSRILFVMFFEAAALLGARFDA
jgi:hypothetical protein